MNMTKMEEIICEIARSYVDACDRGKSMNDRAALEKELLRRLKQHL